MNHEICVKKRAQVKIVRYSAIILPPKLISNEFKQFLNVKRCESCKNLKNHQRYFHSLIDPIMWYVKNCESCRKFQESPTKNPTKHTYQVRK